MVDTLRVFVERAREVEGLRLRSSVKGRGGKPRFLRFSKGPIQAATWRVIQIFETGVRDPGTARSDRSTAHPIVQVKHPVALNRQRQDPPTGAARGPTRSSACRTRTRRVRRPCAPRRPGPRQAPGHRPRQQRPRPCGHPQAAAPWPRLPRRRRRSETAPRGPSPEAPAGASRRPRGRPRPEASRPSRPSGRRRGGRRLSPPIWSQYGRV